MLRGDDWDRGALENQGMGPSSKGIRAFEVPKPRRLLYRLSSPESTRCSLLVIRKNSKLDRKARKGDSRKENTTQAFVTAIRSYLRSRKQKQKDLMTHSNLDTSMK
jgi:hypothetical protein